MNGSKILHSWGIAAQSPTREGFYDPSFFPYGIIIILNLELFSTINFSGITDLFFTHFQKKSQIIIFGRLLTFEF